MIKRAADSADRESVWARIAEPLPAHAIEARLDSKPKESKNNPGQYFGRFLLYVRAQYVVQRLDEIVPGEWDFSLTSDASTFDVADRDGAVTGRTWYVRGRLQILGCVREDYGQGKDPKEAATDALKRCAMRFGIAAELYYAETLFVSMDGDGRFAKPTVDPVTEYVRKFGGLPRLPHKADDVARANEAAEGEQRAHPPSNGAARTPAPSSAPATSAPPAAPSPGGAKQSSSDEPSCPKCGGRMWDNRVGKKNPKAPDFKCRDRSCDGVIWPPKESRASVREDQERHAGLRDEDDPLQQPYSDDLPF